MEIEVDIATRFLTNDHRVYLLFPGEGYRYYHVMRDEEVVFLDIPGFPLPNNTIFAEDIDLVKRLVISDRVRDWHREGNPNDKMPPRAPADVKAYRRTTHRVQFAGAIGRFFSYLKKGDVIVVPPQSYEDDILFGEIADDPNSTFYIDSPDYFGEKIPCRQVKWMATKRRQDAPLWLTRKIASPNPLRQFERSQHNYVYDLMYERYFYNGEFACKFQVGSTEFSTFDNFLLQQLLLYPAALYEARHNPALEPINKNASIALAISHLQFSSSIPDQRISISSPGHVIQYAKNLVPIITGVLLSAAANQPIDADAKSLPIIRVVNSSDNSEASRKCQGDVEAEVTGDLNAAGYARWRELCLIELEIRKRTNLNSGMPTTTGSTRQRTRP